MPKDANICDNCGASTSPLKQPDFALAGSGTSAYLCSIDCVMEYAWKIREAQPKLSKSRA